MFRIRGKPDDPKNIKTAEQHRHLSGAIHVNSLYQLGDARAIDLTEKQKELQRRRQHFHEFRETYQDRLQKYQKRSGNAAGTSEFTIKGFFETSPKIGTRSEYKPVYVKAPLKSVKTVSVEIPVIAKQNAVWCPGRLKSTGLVDDAQKKKNQRISKTDESRKGEQGEAIEVLRKLNELEDNIKSKSEQRDSGVQVQLLKEIQQVDEEINVASMQLQQINDLIEKNKKISAANTSSSQTEDAKDAKSSTTWIVENGPKRKSGDLTGPKRLSTTLSMLNQRLQAIQDKFRSKSTYKSIRDYLSTRQSVHVLYQNDHYKSKTKCKEFPPEEATDTIVSILKLHKEKQQLSKMLKLPSPKSPKSVELKNQGSVLKKHVPHLIEQNDDELDDLFDAELQKSVMKSQFLLKEFKTALKSGNEKVLKAKKKTVHFPVKNTVFSSAEVRPLN